VSRSACNNTGSDPLLAFPVRGGCGILGHPLRLAARPHTGLMARRDALERGLGGRHEER